MLPEGRPWASRGFAQRLTPRPTSSYQAAPAAKADATAAAKATAAAATAAATAAAAVAAKAGGSCTPPTRLSWGFCLCPSRVSVALSHHF
ncbi:hypothetical protein Emed_004902 [Eimeria media]